jgi:ADP-ribose pyrophosphatase YjhB (NUDIX family)
MTGPGRQAQSEAFDRGRDGRSSDLPSGRGIPRWIASSLNYCPRCGAELRFETVTGEDRDRHACATCGHIIYVNPRLVVTTLPITDAGEIVLIRRGIEPGLGSWAQPGGFLEVDETVNQAAIRETFEETGLLVEPGEIVGLYTRLEAAVVTIVFEARIIGGVAAPTHEATEIVAYPADALPWDAIAFRTTFWALGDWLRLRRPDVLPGPADPRGI